MEKEITNLFTSTLVESLETLKTDSKSEWGTMTAKQMLIHLTQSSKMMHLENNKLLTKENTLKKPLPFYIPTKPLARQ